IPAGDEPTALAAADVDGDGRLDLVVAGGSVFGGSSGVRLLLGRGIDGGFSDPVEVAAISLPTSVLAVDFDRDGDIDLAVTSELTGDLSVLRGDGNGAFGAPVDYSVGVAPSEAAPGDFNGDGFADIAVTDSGAGTITVLLNRRDGTFDEATRLEVTGFGSSIAAADLDGDGDLDVATGSLLVFPGEGSGGFGEPFPFTLGGNAFSTIAADLDGDGDLDLATATGTVLSLRFNHSIAARSADRDGDLVPDECTERFRRGDANGDGGVNVSDAPYLLGFLFSGGPLPQCLEAADVDDSGGISLTDAVFLLSSLFRGGPPPPLPGAGECGLDPGESPSRLGCGSYTSC
ncbi:MAG: FG-GAP-like repeat-containing protein, partial [Chloroflexi bacterium]|nr:FG-GAP-like repeat-containing protein [Chloroflexota bacterium]